MGLRWAYVINILSHLNYSKMYTHPSTQLAKKGQKNLKFIVESIDPNTRLKKSFLFIFYGGKGLNELTIK